MQYKEIEIEPVGSGLYCCCFCAYMVVKLINMDWTTNKGLLPA